MMEMVILLGVFGLLICFASPPIGMFITLAVGFLADPLRKTLPGEPVFLVAVVAIFAGVTFFGAVVRGVLPPPKVLLARTGRMRRPILFFLALVLAQSAISLVRTGSPVIAGIGVLAYTAPIPAVLLGYAAGSSQRSMIRIISFYVLVVAIFASGIYLDVAGWHNRLFYGVGEELMVYSPTTGEAMQLFCGLFRTSEIAAWHCATAACFLIILAAAYRRKPQMVALAGLGSVYLFVAIVFTGRRKAFAAVVLFGLLFGLFLLRHRRSPRTLIAVFVVAITGAALFGETAIFSENFATRYQMYFEREQTTTPTSAVERLKDMTVDSVGYTVRQNGFFGVGAGVGSQGAQHFGGGAEVVGGSAEGGLGKILAELGVPGFALILWIGYLTFRRLMREIRRFGRTESVPAVLSLGLIALIATNAIEFVTAHQAFGDPFVLLMLGWMLGILLGLLRRERAARRPAPRLPQARKGPSAILPKPILGIEGF